MAQACCLTESLPSAPTDGRSPDRRNTRRAAAGRRTSGRRPRAGEPPFDSAGSHFNPTQRQHGRDNPQGPHDAERRSIRQEGGFDRFVPRGVSLYSGPKHLLDGDGASLVVHERADDYVTDPAGNAGARIACGVITAR